ncbi:unnamed protein product [Moneuplotes crassus]|uniref:Uncharacterized protein n=1 Tax=Euplotes crassus TaxID=5936 RepID=A0AAD1UL03_EUPCR|nr:unnamed protein product [Moneuplotes crassus]
MKWNRLSDTCCNISSLVVSSGASCRRVRHHTVNMNSCASGVAFVSSLLVSQVVCPSVISVNKGCSVGFTLHFRADSSVVDCQSANFVTQMSDVVLEANILCCPSGI